MKQRDEPDPPNMTPMIDIVFQMIIFFVFTVDFDKAKFDREIDLPMAPDGMKAEKLDPLTIHLVVDKDGDVRIGNLYYTQPQLKGLLQNTLRRIGRNDIPVVIRGAAHVRHQAIKDTMNSVTGAGFWRIEYAAIKEKKT